MGCGQVYLLGDGNQTDLPGPEALKEGDLLGGVPTEAVGPDHDDGVREGSARINHLDEPGSAWPIREELGSRHTLVPDDLSDLVAESVGPSPDPGLLSVEAHPIRGLLRGRDPDVTGYPHSAYYIRTVLRLQRESFGLVHRKAGGPTEDNVQGRKRPLPPVTGGLAKLRVTVP